MSIIIRNHFLFTSLLIFLSVPLNAQNANFDDGKAQYRTGAGNTISNKDLKINPPITDLPFVLITGVKFKNCDRGVPTETELSNLDRVSDSIYINVTTHVKNIMAGTFTYQCERLEYYYIADTAKIRERLIALYQNHFSSYEPYINIKADKNREAYLKFLYPNEETMEYMQNEKVLIGLEKQGDKLDKERPVNHRIYFASEKDMACFIPYATQHKFNVAEKGKGKPNEKDKAFILRISRSDKVDLAAISKITVELRREAKQCKGLYDGWDTVVVR